jgi:hypothetical protein
MADTILGDGPLVLALSAGFAGSAGHAALAKRFRVLVADLPTGDAGQAGRDLAAKAGESATVGLLAFGDAASAAVHAAAALGERASALVLVSPQGLPLGDAASDLGRLLTTTPTPKAVLIGSRDDGQPRDALSRYRRGLTRCSPVLVYGAGADIAADRPDAFADVAGDFLDRQARFAFATETVALQR